MKIVTVDSADLKAVLSLLRVYRGVDKPGGHVKSPNAGPLDPSTSSVSTTWRERSKRRASENPWPIVFSSDRVPVQG